MKALISNKEIAYSCKYGKGNGVFFDPKTNSIYLCSGWCFRVFFDWNIISICKFDNSWNLREIIEHEKRYVREIDSTLIIDFFMIGWWKKTIFCPMEEIQGFSKIIFSYRLIGNLCNEIPSLFFTELIDINLTKMEKVEFLGNKPIELYEWQKGIILIQALLYYFFPSMNGWIPSCVYCITPIISIYPIIWWEYIIYCVCFFNSKSAKKSLNRNINPFSY